MTQKIPVFDGHNDMLLRYVRGEEAGTYDFLKRTDKGHLDIERCEEAGFAGGFFAVFIPNPRDPEAASPDWSQYRTEAGLRVPLPDPLARDYSVDMAMAMIAHLYKIEAASEGRFKVVRNVDDLESCITNGTMAGILHFEGAEAIDEDLDALEVFYQAGLRSIGPVWSRGNAFAEGVPFAFPHSPDTGPGLTDAGKRLVKACNSKGIMIDLSHMNEKGFWDVAALSDAPLVATHSNVHNFCPSSRNLTDKQLDAIKASDGMVGLNFAVIFLREDGVNEADTPIDVMVKHIDYLVERVGIDRVGFGSDFDGATVPAEIKDVTGVQRLLEALLKTGYDDESLRKIAYQNWLRVLRKTWK